jgi:hypothetical protein
LVVDIAGVHCKVRGLSWTLWRSLGLLVRAGLAVVHADLVPVMALALSFRVDLALELLFGA